MAIRSLKSLLALGVIAITSLSSVTARRARRDIAKTLAPIANIGFRQPQPVAKYTYTPNLRAPSIHQQTLHPVSRNANPRSGAAILGQHQRMTSGAGGYVNITEASALGTIWAVEIGWSGTPLLCVLDTASSDTWVVQSNFTCMGALGGTTAREKCSFGPGFAGDFQYGQVYDVGLDINYADGSYAQGPMGYSDITIGNMTVKKQQVGLVNNTYWVGGDNQTSGIISFGYPALTSAYEGGQASGSQPWINQASYNPLFTNMMQQNLSQPMFSVAIDRHSSDGALAFGGIPSVPGIDYTKLATADILIVDLINNPTDSFNYSFFTVVPDAYYYNKTYNTMQHPFIVDTGTTLIYLPPDMAEDINAAFIPAAEYLFDYGSFYVECDAQPPEFAIRIDGVDFFIHPEDMIYQDLIDPYTGKCMTAIASGQEGPYILGDVFLQNVVAVFDVGNAQMHFLGHQHY